MKVTLLMAITVNGYIADEADNTDWVKDLVSLKETIAQFKNVVLGKRTYLECMKYDAFPYQGALNIVLTHDKDLIDKSDETVIFSDKDPQGIISLLQDKGFEKVLIIGGGMVNGSFLKAGLIDEVILDVHPLVMAKGVRLFNAEFGNINLKLLDHKEINDQIIQIKYKVLK